MILLEIWIYALNNPCPFGRCYFHLKNMWQLLCVSLGKNHVKTGQNLKNSPKYEETSLTNSFAANLHMYFQQQK